jgi:hypothetical protein
MVSFVHPLVSRFERAGPWLQVASAPLAHTTNTSIVQLDIARGRSKSEERFRLWPGHRTNRIEVLDVDREQEQLVLMIHQPRRRFEFEMPLSVAKRSDVTVVRVKNKTAWVERFTDDRKRHFLCGMDEQHCFIAQLPEPVSTVAQAHGVLKPAGLGDAQTKAKSPAIRQGEFFFVPVAGADLKRLLQLGRGTLPRRNIGIAQAANGSRAGRPHRADEVWVIAESGAPGQTVLVKGRVRHPDHRTVRFSEWMRVFQNREAYEVPPPGVLWVD